MDPEPPDREPDATKPPQLKPWETLSAREEPRPLGIGAGLGLGLLLILVGVGLIFAVQSLIPFALVTLMAFGTLFHRRVRMIFVGYVTLIILSLLVLAMVCGSMGIH